MLAYVIPTRDRPERLLATLARLGGLPPHGAQVVVVDNASAVPPALPMTLANGTPVELVLRSRNAGAAARNDGARGAGGACRWLVMLDDDSYPVDLGFLAALEEAGDEVGAIGGEITLPERGGREAGGLPEVFVGCGVAIRREAFLAAGGYDPAFDYYAEEYDLCAKLLLMGMRVGYDRRLRVAHHKVARGRSMDRVLRRLVRNNGWTAQRYAPERVRRAEVRRVAARYGQIAHLERAGVGYLLGLAELAATLSRQARRPMPEGLWERFTGLAAARVAVAAALAAGRFSTAAVVEEGKNVEVVRRALEEAGVRLVGEEEGDVVAIGTMSPGPMLDGLARWEGKGRRVVVGFEGVMGRGTIHAGESVS